jgi:hypothetical protein
MSRQEQWKRAIAGGYGSARLDPVRLGIILVDSGLAAASAAHDRIQMLETGG